MEWMLMPLRRYAEFHGRSQRKELWMFVLLQVIVYSVLSILLVALFGASDLTEVRAGNFGAVGGAGAVLVLAMGLFWLATLLPNLSVGVRRLHDSDRSGFLILIWGVPYLLSLLVPLFSVFAGIGALVLIVFYCLAGTPGPNRFGPDPRGGAQNFAEVFS